MGRATLTRKRTIMRIKRNVAMRRQGAVVFEQEVDPSEHRTMFDIAIPKDVWTEFGKPRVITVSIEPGDLLNE